jgi:hypothetical protein
MEDPLQGFEWNQTDAPPDLEEGLFTVVAKDSAGKFHAVGTGFVIRALNDAALAISAGHVFDEVQKLQHRHLRRSHASTLQEFAPQRKPIDVSLAGLAVLTKVKSSVVVSSVEGLAFDELGDIGVVQLRPQSTQAAMYPLREYLLEDELPEKGQLVCVASYVSLACHTDDQNTFRIERQAVLRVGKILNVFSGGQRLCRGPCFETSIPMVSGMSGGPVFLDDAGGAMRVVGLVCSDPDRDGPEKNDRSVSGRSLVARLPVRRLSGSAKGVQEVAMSFVPTLVAGVFSSFQDIRIESGRASTLLP